MYVLDVVDALLVVASRKYVEQKGGTVYDFGVYNAVSTLELVKKIISMSDKRGLRPLVQVIKNDDESSVDLDGTNLIEHLDWTPNYDLTEGLHKTLKWYSKSLAS